MSNVAQIFSMGQGATAIRVQPGNVGGNEIMQLTAVGNNQGIVRLVDIAARIIFRELHIHTCPIK